MTEKFAALALALLLAACAQAYDRQALPAAALTLQKDVFACESKQEVRPVKNFSQFTACQVAAERNFANSIHLAKMDVFETYADRMMALAAERDAGLADVEKIQSRAAAIRKNYWAACNCNIRERRIARTYGGGDTGSFYNGGAMGGGGLAAGGVIFSW